ncbi:MAG: hypothetical protein ACKV2Q_21930 [Planctomycetaceae bacterium]
MAKKNAVRRPRLEAHPQDDLVAPWGEEMFPDLAFDGFSTTGLLIPKIGREELDLPVER